LLAEVPAHKMADGSLLFTSRNRRPRFVPRTKIAQPRISCKSSNGRSSRCMVCRVVGPIKTIASREEKEI